MPSPVNSDVMLTKKQRLALVGFAVLVVTTVFAVPPRSFHAVAYWILNRSELQQADSEFASSGETEWNLKDQPLGPIYVSPNGGRLYFIGSVYRFGRQYDLAFVKDGQSVKYCTPFLFHLERPLFCSLSLPSNWAIHFTSVI